MSEKTQCEPKMRQRLVVFLDGTWNNKDDCTNVLNIYNLVREGDVGGGWFQRKKYDEGVGTGALDSVSGGAFGNGLELNVREAYDWLVEHFCDSGAGESYQADEIYVFGFSRGAYTARSLVGFIARCGLLRRGAPLTVGQLWQGYGELESSNQQEPEILIDRLLKQGRFRQLSDLVEDPWRGGRLRVPPEEMNPTEKLLVQWSSRAPITFLGVYDTVGALGIDALAIPGLRSQAGRLHNLRPSSIIRHFRHALGIDEHRTSFQHSPLFEYRSHEKAGEQRSGLVQRWFVGAHSNVGGGYEDNELAHRPLQWMVEEARALQCLVVDEPRPRRYAVAGLDPSRPAPRDSYAEFAWPFGTYLLRTKRNYRRIVPPPEVRAGRRKAGDRPDSSPAGFELHSREQIDPSVWEYAAENPGYAPPNLVEFAQREPESDPRAGEVAGRAVPHEWPPRLGGGYPGIFLWSLLAGLGAAVVDGVFQIFDGSIGPRDWIAASVASFLAVGVDWLEGRLNLKLAAGQGGVAMRAAADAIFWTRSILVIFFFAGLLGVAGFFFAVGWNYGTDLGSAFLRTLEVADPGWALPLSAGAGLALFTLLGRLLGPVKKGKALPAPPAPAFARRALALAGWLLATAAAVAGLILIGHSAWHIAGQAFGPVSKLSELRPGAHPRESAIFAGHFLFLLLSLAYLLRSLFWVGEPMNRVNLGSVTSLMLRTSGAAVLRVLERWRLLVECRWGEDREQCARQARNAVRSAVAESLWRDIVGLIPVYTIVLLYGLHFGAHFLGYRWLAEPLPLWWMIPLAIAGADWIETGIHLSYLGPGNGPFRQPGLLRVGAAWLAGAAKLAGFAFAGLAVSLFLVQASLRVTVETGFDGGWRGALAATWVLIILGVLLGLSWGAGRRLLRRLPAVLGGRPAGPSAGDKVAARSLS